MQGQKGELTTKEQVIYLEYNKYIGSLLSKIRTDVLVIHDPQPAPALSFLNSKPKVSIWRCHIDTSTPNLKMWNFLLPYLKKFDQFIFTLPEYSNQAFPKDKISLITPVIDPLSPKNVKLEKTKAKKFLQELGINTLRPLITQVARFDPWKDPEGVVTAYRLAKRSFPELQLAMVAQMASDDPEGQVVYEKIKRLVRGNQDIFLFANLPNNDFVWKKVCQVLVLSRKRSFVSSFKKPCQV